MKRSKLFTAFATLAGLGLSLAAASEAYGSRGWRGHGHGHHDHDDDYHHRDRHVTYTVNFHLDCEEETYRARSRREAIEITHELRSYGVDAHRHGTLVHYSLDGEESVTFRSHAAAHRLERWLERLGFHVEVVS